MLLDKSSYSFSSHGFTCYSNVVKYLHSCMYIFGQQNSSLVRDRFLPPKRVIFYLEYVPPTWCHPHISDSAHCTWVFQSLYISVWYCHHAYTTVPAQVQDVNGSNNITEFETLVISCEVLGHPLPLVRWSRNGESLDVLQTSALGARINITHDIHIREEAVPFLMSRLQIVNMTSSDGGTYQCSAENGYPPSTGQLSVSVLRKFNPILVLVYCIICAALTVPSCGGLYTDLTALHWAFYP